MRPLTLAITLLAASCLVIGCSKSQAATLAGNYTLDIDKTVAPLAGAQAEMMKRFRSSLELKEDMSFAASFEGHERHTCKGTWKVAGGKITFDQTHEDDKENKETKVGTINDGVISITRKEDDQEMMLYFAKAK